MIDPVGAPDPAVGRGDGVGVEEAGVAGLLDQVDAHGADVVGDVLPLVRVAGDPLGVGQGRGDVHLRPRPAKTEGLPGAPVPHEARRPGQRAHRRRPAVEGCAAHPPPLDERDLGPQLRGLERGGDPAGPPPMTRTRTTRLRRTTQRRFSGRAHVERDEVRRRALNSCRRHVQIAGAGRDVVAERLRRRRDDELV